MSTPAAAKPVPAHVLAGPKNFIVLRIVQLVLAVVVLGLAAYGLNYIVFAGIGLTLFSAIASIITTVYIIVATLAVAAMYNYWAILGLEILCTFFWLISFAILASDVAPAESAVNSSYCYYGTCYSYTSATKNYVHVLAAAAGLGGVMFVLHIISLVFHSLWLHRHRKAGGHCVTATGEAAAAGGAVVPPAAPQAPVVESKYPPNQYPQQPQPAYQGGPPMQQQQVYQQAPPVQQQQYVQPAPEYQNQNQVPQPQQQQYAPNPTTAHEVASNPSYTTTPNTTFSQPYSPTPPPSMPLAQNPTSPEAVVGHAAGPVPGQLYHEAA